MNDEVEKEITSFVLRLKNQIIFEHYVKVRDMCYSSMLEDGCTDCENKCDLYEDCFIIDLIGIPDDQLKAFIKNVERGE